MGKNVAFTVSETDAGKRLDRFLQGRSLTLSRSRIKQLIENGQFLVNDQQTKAGVRLKAGDQVAGVIPEPRPLEARPEDIHLDILYEDSHIIVVNKAPGMVVHPAPGVDSGTLVNALLFHCKDLSGINGVLRPGIVHRLDRYTSGVMVAAKNDLAHESLVRQFTNRTVEKRYLAVVYGGFPKREGLIEASIGRHPKRRTMISTHSRRSRQAVTRWRVLKTLRSFTLLEIYPKTGRTHQIRVHLASIGHPILGDPVYCRKRRLRQIVDADVKDEAERFHRQALHASDLRFFHPDSHDSLAFHAPLPEDMGQIIRFLELGRMNP